MKLLISSTTTDYYGYTHTIDVYQLPPPKANTFNLRHAVMKQVTILHPDGVTVDCRARSYYYTNSPGVGFNVQQQYR